MSDHQPEPTRRQWLGFWTMIGQQTQNAFNDKAAQFILIPLGGAIGYAVESWATVMIALPFVLFAPLAGWVSDRFSKRNVLLASAIVQLLVLTWLCLAMRMQSMNLALLGFFALAVQSAFFSPAKMGINKELVGHKHLGFASGIQQMMAMLAMLVGQIAAGVIYDRRWEISGRSLETAWSAATGPLLVLTAFAVPAIGLAWLIPRTPAQGAEKLSAGLLIRHFTQLKDLWSYTGLRRASFAVAFFWGFAAFINLWSVKLAKEITAGQAGFGTLSSWFMAAASLGMVLGFGTASYLLRRRIELGWVPLGGLAMTITALLLALIDPSGTHALLAAGHAGPMASLRAIITPSSGAFLWVLALLAYFSALFLAPLNAWMQDRYPPEKRGELQASVNLQDCLAGIIAAALISLLSLGLSALGVTAITVYRIEIAIAGLACGLITWFILRLLPSDLARVIGLTILRVFYRIRAVDPGNVPAKGGVFLLPNHISWLDAFFITAACPREVRFVMDAAFMKKPLVRWFCRLFNTVPLALDKPREALRTAADAIAQGDVVCLFPEGQLSRTGTLGELKRGFEIIARQAGAPVVPVWLDGAWGSIFSFERGRFFKKWPYRVPYGLVVAFGKALAPRQARTAAIRQGILEAAAAAIDSRCPPWRKRLPSADRRSPSALQQRANGYQLGQVPALPRRTPYISIDPSPCLLAFSQLFKSPALSPNSPKARHIRHWIGGSELRQTIITSPAPDQEIVFFDLSPDALTPIVKTKLTHCPGLAIDGIIISLSFPDPPRPYKGSPPQASTKPGSHGMLLPGFSHQQLSEEKILISGPTTGPSGILLPANSRIDSEGFVFTSTTPND